MCRCLLRCVVRRIHFIAATTERRIRHAYTDMRESHALILPFAQRPIQLSKESLVVTPSFMNCNMKVEEDPGAEDGLQLDPRFGADAFHHVPALADDDRLLRLPLHDDRRVNLDQVLILFLFPSIDRYRGGIWQLVAGVLQ